MTIFTNTYIPYEFANKYECFKHIEHRCHGILKSIRLLEKDNEHLTIRCPLSGDYLDIVGSEDELIWLDEQLSCHNLYRVT